MKFIKTFFILAILVVSAFSSNAQTPFMGFNFQGYAIDPSGAALAQEAITVKFSIVNSISSSVVFDESQDLTSDAFGVFHCIIGYTKQTTFKNIDFTKKDVFYKLIVEVKKTTGGSFTEISNSQMNAVPYARHAENGVPVGTIIAYGGLTTKIPQGWLLCDGSQLTEADYPALYDVIGYVWGKNGTNFLLPNLQGRFLRGVGGGAAINPDASGRIATNGGNTGDNVGSYQGDATKRPNTDFSTSSDGAHSHDVTDSYFYEQNNAATTPVNYDYNGVGNAQVLTRTTTTNSDHSHTIPGGGDNETRPTNAAVYYIIKY